MDVGNVILDAIETAGMQPEKRFKTLTNEECDLRRLPQGSIVITSQWEDEND